MLLKMEPAIQEKRFMAMQRDQPISSASACNIRMYLLCTTIQNFAHTNNKKSTWSINKLLSSITSKSIINQNWRQKKRTDKHPPIICEDSSSWAILDSPEALQSYHLQLFVKNLVAVAGVQQELRLHFGPSIKRLSQRGDGRSWACS